MRKAAKIILYGCSLLASFGIAEVLLQFTQDRTLHYGWWFSDDIHVPDERFGFRFKPHYQGSMRHPDGVFHVPLRLDERGFRSASQSCTDPACKEVVFIGGASNIFGYGIRDEHTVPNQVSAHARLPLKVVNTATPGAHLHRAFHIYRELAEAGADPDLVVLSLVGIGGFYRELPDNLEQLPDTRPTEDLFRYHPGNVLQPRGKLAEKTDRWYYRSMILNKLFYLADTWMNRLHLPTGAPLSGEAHDQNQRKLLDLVHFIYAYFESRNIPVLLTMFPSEGQPANLYDPLSAGCPDGMYLLNLHRQLNDQLTGGSIAGDHFDIQRSMQYGEAIAKKIDEILTQP